MNRRKNHRTARAATANGTLGHSVTALVRVAVLETMRRRRLTVVKAAHRWECSEDTIVRLRKRGMAIPPLRNAEDGQVFLDELARAFFSRNGRG
jgi:hypothetical protein